MVARRKLRIGGIACLAAVVLFGGCDAPRRTGGGKAGRGSSPADAATAEVAGADVAGAGAASAPAAAKDGPPAPAEAATGREEPGETVPLFETDRENLGWRFDHGGEFPGARGSLAVDPDAEREGRPTLRLSGDFTGGGNYVQMLRDLAGADVGSLSLWLKADTEIDSIVTRLVDQSICHQIRFRVKPTTEWQRVTFPLRRFFANERKDDSVVRYECWGGKNDKVWRGPCKRVCILATAPGKRKKATLWINDIGIVGPPTPVTTTVMPARLSANSVAPGSFVKITYNWRPEEPLLRDNSAFVHFVDKLGRTVHQDDHTPSIVTGSPGWRGEVSYERRVIIPAKLADGSYDIIVGLYHRRPEPPGWKREPLKAGPGVEDAGERRFKVGTLVVDRNAPRPKADTEEAPTLSLDGFEITFSEEFDGKLDVSPWGPGTRWIAHTPWSGDFGDAAFANPREGFPFTIEKGVLRIEARKDENLKDKWKRKWEAGLLASNAPDGSGFSQRFGYFVMRAKLPGGPGVWPAFWLVSSYNRRRPETGADGSVEIDVVEFYGHNPGAYSSTVHVWKPDPHRAVGTTVTTRMNEVSTGFHDYGVMVEPDFITMYFDGVEVWKTKTPAEHNKPLMILLNLALGSGWPIDKTPSPSYMYVDYVRAYAKK